MLNNQNKFSWLFLLGSLTFSSLTSGQNSLPSQMRASILFDAISFLRSQYKVDLDSSLVRARFDLNFQVPEIDQHQLFFYDPKFDSIALKEIESFTINVKNRNYITFENMSASKGFSKEILFNSPFGDIKKYYNSTLKPKLYLEFYQPIGGWKILDANVLLNEMIKVVDKDYQILLSNYTKLYLPVFFWYKTKNIEIRKTVLIQYDLPNQSDTSFKRASFIELD